MRGANLQKLLRAEIDQNLPTDVHVSYDIPNLPPLALLEAAQDGTKFMLANDGPSSSAFALKAITEFWAIVIPMDDNLKLSSGKQNYYHLKSCEVATNRVLALCGPDFSKQDSLGVMEIKESEVSQAACVIDAMRKFGESMSSAIRCVRLGMISELGEGKGDEALTLFRVALGELNQAVELYRENQRG